MTDLMQGANRVSCEGGCHCGAVRFRLQIPRQLDVRRCNCSICRMTGFLHLTVKQSDFELLCGKKSLAEYRFNTGVARHWFCSHCGIKSFYVPRSHPDHYSVHAACVDLPDNIEVRVTDFDGANWEQNIEQIKDIVN